jgi:hypothetical protein
MKGTCRCLYRLHCEFNPAAAMDKEIATSFLIRAWEALATAALDDAWALYEGRDESIPRLHLAINKCTQFQFYKFSEKFANLQNSQIGLQQSSKEEGNNRSIRFSFPNTLTRVSWASD